MNKFVSMEFAPSGNGRARTTNSGVGPRTHALDSAAKVTFVEFQQAGERLPPRELGDRRSGAKPAGEVN